MHKNTEDLKKILERFSDPRIIGLIVFGVVALLVTWSGVKVVQKNYELDKKISIARQQNEIARLENANLKLRNAYFESDLYLELAARRQLGRAAKGEALYIVPNEVALANTIEIDTSVKSGGSAEAQKPRSKVQQNLESWKKFLFR